MYNYHIYTKIYHSLLCALLLACVVFNSDTCRGAEAEINNLLAFGDSLTEACYIDGSSSCGWVGVNSNGYTSELESMLNALEMHEESGVKVFNYGRGGEQTHEGIARLSNLLDNYTCDAPAGIILLMEGTNDLLQGKLVGNISYNLELMIAISREHGLEILLATIPPDPDHPNMEITALNNAIRGIAAEQVARYGDVTLVEQYNALAPNWVSYTNPLGCYNDRTHPNNAGFDAMAAVWFKNLPEYMTVPPLPPLSPGVLMILLDSE
jgi:lysophospholipase L1-like esterase